MVENFLVYVYGNFMCMACCQFECKRSLEPVLEPSSVEKCLLADFQTLCTTVIRFSRLKNIFFVRGKSVKFFLREFDLHER